MNCTHACSPAFLWRSPISRWLLALCETYPHDLPAKTNQTKPTRIYRICHTLRVCKYIAHAKNARQILARTDFRRGATASRRAGVSGARVHSHLRASSGLPLTRAQHQCSRNFPTTSSSTPSFTLVCARSRGERPKDLHRNEVETPHRERLYDMHTSLAMLT